MTGIAIFQLLVAGLAISLADSFSESQIEVISVTKVGIQEKLIAFHNKNGVCRWTLYAKNLHGIKTIAASKWYEGCIIADA